jgi:hypothetical protein
MRMEGVGKVSNVGYCSRIVAMDLAWIISKNKICKIRQNSTYQHGKHIFLGHYFCSAASVVLLTLLHHSYKKNYLGSFDLRLQLHQYKWFNKQSCPDIFVLDA